MTVSSLLSKVMTYYNKAYPAKTKAPNGSDGIKTRHWHGGFRIFRGALRGILLETIWIRRRFWTGMISKWVGRPNKVLYMSRRLYYHFLPEEAAQFCPKQEVSAAHFKPPDTRI